MLEFKQCDSKLTLRDGLAEYYASRDDLAGDLGPTSSGISTTA